MRQLAGTFAKAVESKDYQKAQKIIKNAAASPQDVTSALQHSIRWYDAQLEESLRRGAVLERSPVGLDLVDSCVRWAAELVFRRRIKRLSDALSWWEKQNIQEKL